MIYVYRHSPFPSFAQWFLLFGTWDEWGDRRVCRGERSNKCVAPLTYKGSLKMPVQQEASPLLSLCSYIYHSKSFGWTLYYYYIIYGQDVELLPMQNIFHTQDLFGRFSSGFHNQNKVAHILSFSADRAVVCGVVADAPFWKWGNKVEGTQQQTIHISILPRQAFEYVHLRFIKSDAAHTTSE